MSRIIKKIIKEHEDNFDIQGGSITEVSTVVIDGHEVEAWNPYNQDATHGQISDNTTIPDHTGPTYNVDNGTTGGSGGDPVRDYTYDESGLSDRDTVITVKRLYTEVIKDFSQEKLQEYQEANGVPYAIMKDGTKVQVNWSDVRYVRTSSTASVGINVAQLAAANNQNFWTDNDGAHVTSDAKDSWLEEYDETNHGTLAAPTLNNPWHNILINSLGILLRKGLINLTSITDGAISFFDGTGNNSSNVMATFGSSGAQIGKSSENHVVLDNNGLSTYDSSGNLIPVYASNIEADHANIGTLNATIAKIGDAWIDGLTATDISTMGLSASTITALRASFDHLSTGILTASDLQAIHGFIDDFSALRITSEYLASTYATISTLESDYATINELESNYATIATLESDYATINELESNYATISTLESDYATINELESNYATISTLESDYATIASLNAATGKFDNLSSVVLAAIDANIDNLTADEIAATDIQALNASLTRLQAGTATVQDLTAISAFIEMLAANRITTNYLTANYADIGLANVNNAWIENGVIKTGAIGDAQIQGVSANKLTAGEINADEIIVRNLQASNLKVGRLNGQPVLGGYSYVSPKSSGYSSKNPKTEGWYELSGTTYTLTNDTTVNNAKKYYAADDYVALYDQETIDDMFDDVNDRIDSAIETWTGTAVPTTGNYPANQWTTNALKQEHIGDIYYVVNAGNEADGYTYRYTYDNSQSSYKWTLIKDNQVTAALQRLVDAEGDISALQTFQSETNTWISETDEGLTTIRENHTSLSAVVDKTITNNEQLWYSKANTTAPAAPTARVTSTSTGGNAWRLNVPAYNASYPNYFYCYQWTYADGTYGWSRVTRDIAMGEAQSMARTTSSDLASYITSNNTAITGLQNQIDARVDIWYYETAPSLESEPVTLWTDDTIKDKHIGDIYYNTTKGYAYRFKKSGSTYSWARIKDDDISSALSAAQDAQSTADGKRTVFTNTPTPPYAIGDLWVSGSDVKYAIAAKTSTQSYAASDWAQTATDDTLAKGNVKSHTQLWFTKANTTAPTAPTAKVTSTSTNGNAWRVVVPAYNASYPYYYYCYQFEKGDGTFSWSPVVYDQAMTEAQSTARTVSDNLASYISSNNSAIETLESSLQNQIDSQVDIWYGIAAPTLSNTPASGWTDDTTKDKHIGDLYYNMSKGYAYRFNKADSTYSWVRIKDDDISSALSAAQDAQSTADGKRTVFTSTPTVPYDIGDLWVNGSTVKYATTAKTSSQTYAEADWVLTATDDTLAKGNVKSHTQLWFTKANTTAPTAPTAKVTSTSTNGNAWRVVVPAYNASYPYYYYCYQFEKGDGTFSWSAVVYDQAMTETQGQSRTALSTANGNIKSQIQLWFAKANTTAPNPPTAQVTSTSTAGNAWRTVVPVYDASYPKYFYCYQYEKGDGTFAWSPVVYDAATTENQENSRSALGGLSSKVDTTTFTTLVDEVGEQSTTITNLTTKVDSFQVGGRNLLRNTANPSTTNGVDLYMIRSTIPETGIIRFTSTTSGSSYATWSCRYLPYSEYKNDTYTFSVEARLADVESEYTTNKIIIYMAVMSKSRIGATNINSSHDRYAFLTFLNELTTDWKKFSITVSVPDQLTSGQADALVDTSFLTVQVATSSSTLPFDTRHWKLEKGTFATSWTPAPEDMATAEDITTITTTVNTISQTVDSNVARISSVETTTTNLRDEYPNQWKFERYSRPSRVNAANIIPTQDDYIPTNLIDVRYIHEDNFQKNLALGDTYIAKARVYVYITVAAQQEVQVCHDDSAALYLNNELVYSYGNVRNTSTPGSATLNLVVGWNKIEFLLNDQVNSEYCYFLNMKPSEIPNCTKVQAELSAYDDTSMHQRVSEIVQDLDGFKTTVSSTYATSGSVSDLSDRLDNIKVGGRNLLRNTANPSTTNGTDLCRSRSTIPETGIIRLTPTGSASSSAWSCRYLPYSEYKNDTYTFSVEARLADVESEYTVNKFYIYIAVMLESRIGVAVIDSSYDRYKRSTFTNELTNEWKKFSITVSVPDQLTLGPADALVDTSCLTAQITSASSALPVDTRHWKLEKGNSPTDWTPAPEDMASDEELTSTANQLKAHYASSATDSSVAAKEATCNNFALYIGAQVSCTFTAANTAASPTLNVNGTGAKQIRSYSGAALAESEYKWAANSTLLFVYDGSYWRMHDAGITKRLTTAETNISQNSEAITLRATKTEMSQAIDGIQVGGRNLLRTEDITIYSGGAGTVTNTEYSSTGTVLYSRPASQHLGFYITNASRQEIGQSYIVHFKIRETTDTKVVNKIYVFTDNGNLNGNSSNRADVYVDGVRLGSSDLHLDFDLTDGSTKQVDIYYTYQAASTSVYRGIILQCLKGTASAFTVELTELKWETGTKVTGWSPAPEDMQTVAQAQAELTVTNQAIASKVSSTDYTGATVASLINQSADSVKIQAKHVEIDGTAIFNNNDFSTALAGALDDIQIGGRNLLRDTASPNPTNGVTLYWTRSSVPEVGVVRLTPTTSIANATWIVNYLPYSDYNDKIYTFSVEAKLANVSTSYTINKFNMYIGFLIESRVGTANFSPSYDKYKGITFIDKLTTSWQKFYITLKVPDDLTSGVDTALVDTSQLTVHIYNYGSAMPIDTRHWKLEQGTRATEWTQAPEDNEPTGLTIQWDCSSFNNKNSGEGYICRWDYSTQTALNQDAWVRFNGLKRTVTKAQLNPNGLAINKIVYVVVRLSSANAVSGTTYFVWYDSGWKNLDSLSYTAGTSVISDWTWADATDMVIGSFVSTAVEKINECVTYDVPLHYSQINFGAETAYASAASAQATANAAAPKTEAVKRSQRIYYRSNSSTKPTAPTAWVAEASANAYGSWSTKVAPIASNTNSGTTKYPYLYTCEQRETVSGAYSCTTVQLDENTTVIDGGNIITGSVTANKLNATNINASNMLTVGAFNTDSQSSILNSNISIGGRNLFIGSKDFSGAVKKGSISSDIYLNEYPILTYSRTSDQANANVDILRWANFIYPEPDTEYTLSFFAKSDSGVSIVSYFYPNVFATGISSTGATPGGSDSNVTTTLTNTWTKYWITWKPRSDVSGPKTCLVARFLTNTYGDISIACVKFEKGNKATDWTPAPEDVDSSINSAYTLANTANTTANAAAPKTQAIKRSQRIYYRSNSSTKPTAPTAWIAEASANTYGSWSTKVAPIASNTNSGTTKYPYLYTCEQRETVSGAYSCTTVQLDENTTVIDGGNIITGSVTANQLNASDINASNMLTIGAFGTAAQDQILNGKDTGLTIQWDCSSFNNKNEGEGYICKWDGTTQTASDENAWVLFNGVKRTVNKGQINTNGFVLNITIWVVTRLSSDSSTTGTNYLVWYDNSKWNYLNGINYASTHTIADWTWAVATDMIIGSFVMLNTELMSECQTYSTPLSFTQINMGNRITAYAKAAAAQTTANTANTTANAAAPKTTAVKRQQRIYYRSSVSTTPTAPSTWVTETAAKYAANATTAANWTTKYSQLTSGSTKYPYMFTCIQSETVSGTITNSTVLLDDTITVIDGGNIITGSVTANKLNASDINASNVLTVGAFATAEQAKILNENLSVGGRNLLLNTANSKTATIASEETAHYTAYYTRSPYLINIETTFTTDTYLTLSFDWTVSGNTSDTCGIRGYTYNYSMGSVTIGTLTSGHYSKSAKLSSGVIDNITNQSNVTKQRVYIYNSNEGAVLTVSNVKLEYGNMESTWTPAPEDLQTQITTNNTNITNEINQRKAAYGTCSTAAATQEKAVTCTNFVLTTGNLITVKFTTANTYAADVVKLNVNGTGAKNIWVSNAVTSATNQLRWGTGAYITFRYDGTEYVVVGEPRTWYGACAIAEGTAAKTDASIVCAGAVICKGATVVLAMTNRNTAASPTLNIASTGAVAIYTGSSDVRPTVANGTSWLAGTTVSLQFDGSAWRTGGLTYINGDHIITGTIDASKATITNINATNINTGTLSADRIAAGSLGIGKINSTDLNSLTNWYALCDTEADVETKVATITPATTAFALSAGVSVKVKFSITNTAAVANLKLQVNGTTAKAIKYTSSGGSVSNLPAVGYLQASRVYEFIYDGSYWVLQYNYNTNDYNRVKYDFNILAETAITAGRIICGTSSGYKNIGASVAFDISYPLLYAASAIAAGATTGTLNNNYLKLNNIKYSNNATIQGAAANKVVYLKGTVSGTTFTIASSNFLTCTVPTSASADRYIPLGLLVSTTNGYFDSTKEFWGYIGGAFGPAPNQQALESAKTATNYITTVDNNGIKVHAVNNTSSNYALVNANGLTVYKGGNQVATFGDTVLLGSTSSQGARVNTDGMQIFKGGEQVASFGSNISVGSANSNSIVFGSISANGARVNSDGMQVFKGGNQVASFGDSVQIGRNSKSRITLSDRSFTMYDRNNLSYLVLEDLRDDNGYATITEKFTANGSTKKFTLSCTAYINTYQVWVGTTEQTTDITKTNTYFQFSTAPAFSNSPNIKVTYQTQSHLAKGFTFGSRRTSSLVGVYSTVIGYNNEAEGKFAFAEGCQTSANGPYSHSEGLNTSAKGEYSHTEGWYTFAEGYGSHAEGLSTNAYGVASHASGFGGYANGMATHTCGYELISNYDHQFICGIYNSNNSSSIFEVGNGSSSSSLANAFRVTTSNTAYVGSTAVTSDERVKSDITELDPDISYKFIKQLKPKSYIKFDRQELGFVAQDIEKLYYGDILVDESPNFGYDDFKNLSYEGLIAPLVSTVQTLQKENEDLKQKNKELEDRLARLEAILLKDGDI